MTGFAPADTLRTHRSLLLAMECVGWLHMLGKCRVEFLREHGGQKAGYDDLRWFENQTPPFPWDDLLGWVKTEYTLINGHKVAWPGSLTDFLTKHRDRSTSLVGLLQAGHGIASGIEKQSPQDKTIKYLDQNVTHLWQSSAFGHPRCNLLVDPPEVLKPGGWSRLLGEVRRILEDLKRLGGDGVGDTGAWWDWREAAIGPDSMLRKAFSSTLAETRLPNNDVTLWDQSYLAAALFKSALAGAVIEGAAFPWRDNRIKNTASWRLLTVGIGANHYEARAVRIGDWTGARFALDRFLEQVRRLIEVDFAVGSLLYSDGSVQVFSFPGERTDGTGAIDDTGWEGWLQEQIEGIARALHLETPPHRHLTTATRSLVPMTAAIEEARKVLAVPVHRAWTITAPNTPESSGHSCPVCLVRLNGTPTDKQKPCEPCRRRRSHRLDSWLDGRLGTDTIWISEVADGNDRLALLTLSLDIEPWLDGRRLDALRTQAVAEWRRHNPVLGTSANPIDTERPLESLTQYVQGKLRHFERNDPVLCSLQQGYRQESDWKPFFEKIVEDRARAPAWGDLDDDERARWIVHQLFRKLPSPGRVHRFWRESEAFFGRLLHRFREEAAAQANRWRVRRLVLTAGDGSTSSWEDREVYNGRLGEAPLSLLYRKDSGDLLTACNLARLLREDAPFETLRGKSVDLRGDNSNRAMTLVIGSVRDAAGRLGAYHPVIPLELSPTRFRVLVPLEAASRCLDLAIAARNEEMGRVWDRLPLRAGLVAFPRMVPFQAVVEAARALEHQLDAVGEETWRVAEREARDGIVALRLVRPDGGTELRTVHVTVPDGRPDVFYPYLRMEDRALRTTLDFWHPQEGYVYRHALDLRPGDGVNVAPARIARVFLESTGRRFESVETRALADWERMRDVWQLLVLCAPSQAALHGVWSELADRGESWRGPDGRWLDGGREVWLGLVRALFADRLQASPEALDELVEAADATLAWAIEWHVGVLKERIQEVVHG